MNVEKYRKLFLEECREHLQGLNRELLRLESEGEEFDGIDTLFREAHSIKGMSASMGYEPMVALSHAMEDIFDGVRKKTLSAAGEVVALLFEGVDTLGHLTDEVDEKAETSLDVTDLVKRIRDSAEPGPAAPPAVPTDTGAVPEEGEISLETAEDAPVGPAPEEAPGTGGEAAAGEPALPERGLIGEMERQGKTVYRCVVTISQDTDSIQARNFVVLGRLNKAGSIVRSKPTLAEVMEGKGSGVLEALVATERSKEDLSAILLSVPELTDIRIEPFIFPDPPAAKAPPPGAPAGDEEEAEPSRRDASQELMERYLPRKSSTVRVKTDILDDLINIVGELIINRDRLLEVSRGLDSEDLHGTLDRLDLLVRGFQDSIMTVRMMPLETITDRLPRLVRDLARMGGKEIRFEILGQGIELDRAILEELNDVLIHLVRNAIDHGVETPEERRANRKEVRALVRITAGRERDWVWIAVEDDGRGMDSEQIKGLALECGVLSPERAETLDRQDILLLACHPGLSTAREVSDVSGRGVGMDVVKSRVESFGGTLSIDSHHGAGTKTTLHIPLTLAIVQALLVELRGRIFALPLTQVVHTLKVDPGEVEWSRKQAVIRWGKKAVPLRDLAVLLGMPGRDLSAGDPFHVVLTEQAGALTGLAVDELAGACEAVIKPLGLPLKKIAGLAGASIMGDGSTVLVLDVKALS
jgi:two-component system chemotaxis sensor kinase CheA